MKIRSLSITNIRSYPATGALDTGDINVLIGANNSGKSTLLRAIHLFQEGSGFGVGDIRVGTVDAVVTAVVEGYQQGAAEGTKHSFVVGLKRETGAGLSMSFNVRAPQLDHGRGQFPASEPGHLVVPFYSHRKTRTFTDDTARGMAISIRDDFVDMPAKLNRMMHPGFAGHARYLQLCREILGYDIFTSPGERALVVGSYVELKEGQEFIPVTRMGDGVQHIVGLLLALVTAKNKIFLIEELENDLHPKALKALLDLIVERSQDNQFFISTHSNIVVRHLCAEPTSRLFRVSADRDAKVPTSTVELVDNTPAARIEVLRELGYELSDFELSDGWFILEESSAERIIREFLIPMFAPRLSRLQTVAANGANKVEPLFEDFRRLVLFSHLQVPFRQTTWVRVDGDDVGKSVVGQLRNSHKTWPASRFETFTKPQFEHYYPAPFASEVTATLGIADRKERRAAKQVLCRKVIAWLHEDRQRAEATLAESAADVIADLQAMEVELTGVAMPAD
jgi:predicted ATPase